MKAAVYYGPGDIRIEERPKPTAGLDGVVLKVKACGICNILEADAWLRKSPGSHTGIVLGHEYAGEVVEVGANVHTIKSGDRIFGEPIFRPCFACDACYTGDYWRCSNWPKGVGNKYGAVGAFAEYIMFPFVKETPGDENFLKLPGKLSFRDLTLIEPLMLSAGLAKKANVNEVVVVLGQELVGLGTVAKLKEMGVAKIIACDISQKHLDASRELGADKVVNSLEDDIVKVVMKETSGIGADLVIVLDRRPTAYFQAVNLVRTAGRIFTGTGYNWPLAMQEGDVHSAAQWAGPVGAVQKLPLHFDPSFVWAQSAWGTLGPKLPRIHDALALIESGKLTAKKHVTHVFPLDKIKEAFDIAGNPHETIKVVIEQ